MLLSFILLNYNQKELMRYSLNSIKYGCAFSNIEYEIILCDNSSSDDSIDFFTKYCNDNNIKYKIIINNYKKNQSISRNLGIAKANGFYILFLDGDDYFNPISLNNLIKILIHKKYDIIFLDRFYKDENIIKIIKFQPENPFSAGICFYCIRKDFLIKYDIKFEENKYYYYSEDICFYIKLYYYINKSKYYIYNKWFNYFGIKRKNSTNYNKLSKKDIASYYNSMYIDYKKYERNNNLTNLIQKTLINLIR